VDALVQLRRIARALHEAKLEAIMFGNAAAALQGAPVTTLDFDFYFRRTPENLRKLKAVARALGGSLLVPFYPVSSMVRLEVEVPMLQVDFLSSASGVRSFASLRSRAIAFQVDAYELRLASLADIIRSKRAAARPKDLAVLPVLEATLQELEGETTLREAQEEGNRRPARAAKRSAARPRGGARSGPRGGAAARRK
jgi:hypothetical protein